MAYRERPGAAPAAVAVPRRWLMGGAAALGAGGWLAWPALRDLVPVAFAFEPLREPPGFRRIARGEVSLALDPLAGLGSPSTRAAHLADTMAAVRADPCGALFGVRPPPGVVPVASFSDYRCPNCRLLTRRLLALEAGERGSVHLAWHELPILGPASDLGARAALAAKRQGAYLPFHERLMATSFVPTPALVERLARDLGIDTERLRIDMESRGVALEIARSKALAGLFGFIGTPALVVGRTAVLGDMSDRRLRALVERERADGPLPSCA